MNTLTITATLKKTLPSQPTVVSLVAIKNRILGTRYELSLVVIGTQRSRTLNRRYRDTDRPTNVLSFPLASNEGEIFITLPLVHKEAPRYGRTSDNHFRALFIHGCLHLKGYRHGATMDKEEKRLQKKFLPAQKKR